MRNLSFMRTRWGEVKSAVRYPAARKMASKKAQTEPLPFVPATWITRRESSGCPKISRYFFKLSRPPPAPNRGTAEISCSSSSIVILCLLSSGTAGIRSLQRPKGRRLIFSAEKAVLPPEPPWRCISPASVFLPPLLPPALCW